MNIAAIFSAFLGSKDQAKSDVAEVPGTDFIGFVWENDLVDKFLDANAPWPEASIIRPGAQGAQPDMPRILTEQAGAISEIGHFMQPKPAIQQTLVQAEIPDQTVAVPAGAPVNVLAALPLAPDDDAARHTGPDNSKPDKQSPNTPSHDRIASVASVDFSTPDIPTQTQSAQSTGDSAPDTPDRRELPPSRAAAAPPEPPTVHTAVEKPDASKDATQPEPQVRADPAVLPERPEISRAVSATQMAAGPDVGNALPTVAKGAHPPQVIPQPAAPAPASPRHVAFLQARVPQSAEPQAPLPQAANPQASSPQTAAPQSAVPKIPGPQAANPQAAVPNAPGPQSAEPQMPVPQPPASSDTLPNRNPFVSNATETTPSPRIAQSPNTTEKPLPVPIHRPAETPVTRIQSHPETPRPRRESRAYANGQTEKIASSHSAHRTMAEPIVEPAVVASHSGQAKAHPIGQAAVPRTLKATIPGKPLDGFMRSEAIISTAEHSPFRPPHQAQTAQQQPPGASPVSAQSAETPLPSDAVMSRPGATIVAQVETSPMPALPFAELSVTPANATVEILPPIQPRIDHAPRVIQAIAEAARGLQDRPVEVTLNPEELGRVRLTLRSVDGSMSVSVAVERPETLDLLRRNIDMLASQLRELGYKDLSFSFAGHGESFGSSDEHRGDHQLPATDDPQEPPRPSPMQFFVTNTGGIDIRL